MKRRCTACMAAKEESSFPHSLSLLCNTCSNRNSILSVAAGGQKVSHSHAIGTGIGSVRETISNALSKSKYAAERHNGEEVRRTIGSPEESVESLRLAKDAVDDLLKKGDDRTLFDKLHEATFGDATTMQYVSDKYLLRQIIRKTHCFTIDSPTSALISDFSLAIAPDLESVRRMAIPPFPYTWFDIDNIARLKRISALGVGLTPTAASPDVCKRIGWLITPHTRFEGYCMTYVCEVDTGIIVAPLSIWWHTGPSGDSMFSDDFKHVGGDPNIIERVVFGVTQSNVHLVDAFPMPQSFHYLYGRKKGYGQQVVDLMSEIEGELRFVWGLLLALGTSHSGDTETETRQQVAPSRVAEAKGKKLFSIEHKVLTIKLKKKMTVEKVATRAMIAARKRWHEVRGHMRRLKSGKMIPVLPHTRGDERLGRIEKTYKVEQ